MEKAFASNASTPTSKNSPTTSGSEVTLQSMRRLSNLPSSSSGLTPKKNRRDKLMDVILTYCSRLIDQSELSKASVLHCSFRDNFLVSFEIFID